MTQPELHIQTRRPAEGISILDLQGEITASAEDPLFAAYVAAGGHATAIILNMSGVESIDSFGAGLLIVVLARARNRKQRLLAYGLNEPCRRAFELTRLNEAVGLYADESKALSSL